MNQQEGTPRKFTTRTGRKKQELAQQVLTINPHSTSTAGISNLAGGSQTTDIDIDVDARETTVDHSSSKRQKDIHNTSLESNSSLPRSKKKQTISSGNSKANTTNHTSNPQDRQTLMKGRTRNGKKQGLQNPFSVAQVPTSTSVLSGSTSEQPTNSGAKNANTRKATVTAGYSAQPAKPAANQVEQIDTDDAIFQESASSEYTSLLDDPKDKDYKPNESSDSDDEEMPSDDSKDEGFEISALKPKSLASKKNPKKKKLPKKSGTSTQDTSNSSKENGASAKGMGKKVASKKEATGGSEAATSSPLPGSSKNIAQNRQKVIGVDSESDYEDDEAIATANRAYTSGGSSRNLSEDSDVETESIDSEDGSTLIQRLDPNLVGDLKRLMGQFFQEDQNGQTLSEGDKKIMWDPDKRGEFEKIQEKVKSIQKLLQGCQESEIYKIIQALNLKFPAKVKVGILKNLEAIPNFSPKHYKIFSENTFDLFQSVATLLPIENRRDVIRKALELDNLAFMKKFIDVERKYQKGKDVYYPWGRKLTLSGFTAPDLLSEAITYSNPNKEKIAVYLARLLYTYLHPSFLPSIVKPSDNKVKNNGWGNGTNINHVTKAIYAGLEETVLSILVSDILYITKNCYDAKLGMVAQEARDMFVKVTESAIDRFLQEKTCQVVIDGFLLKNNEISKEEKISEIKELLKLRLQGDNQWLSDLGVVIAYQYCSPCIGKMDVSNAINSKKTIVHSLLNNKVSSALNSIFMHSYIKNNFFIQLYILPELQKNRDNLTKLKQLTQSMFEDTPLLQLIKDKQQSFPNNMKVFLNLFFNFDIVKITNVDQEVEFKRQNPQKYDLTTESEYEVQDEINRLLGLLLQEDENGKILTDNQKNIIFDAEAITSVLRRVEKLFREHENNGVIIEKKYQDKLTEAFKSSLGQVRTSSYSKALAISFEVTTAILSSNSRKEVIECALQKDNIDFMSYIIDISMQKTDFIRPITWTEEISGFTLNELLSKAISYSHQNSEKVASYLAKCLYKHNHKLLHTKHLNKQIYLPSSLGSKQHLTDAVKNNLLKTTKAILDGEISHIIYKAHIKGLQTAENKVLITCSEIVNKLLLQENEDGSVTQNLIKSVLNTQWFQKFSVTKKTILLGKIISSVFSNKIVCKVVRNRISGESTFRYIYKYNTDIELVHKELDKITGTQEERIKQILADLCNDKSHNALKKYILQQLHIVFTNSKEHIQALQVAATCIFENGPIAEFTPEQQEGLSDQMKNFLHTWVDPKIAGIDLVTGKFVNNEKISETNDITLFSKQNPDIPKVHLKDRIYGLLNEIQLDKDYIQQTITEDTKHIFLPLLAQVNLDNEKKYFNEKQKELDRKIKALQDVLTIVTISEKSSVADQIASLKKQRDCISTASGIYKILVEKFYNDQNIDSKKLNHVKQAMCSAVQAAYAPLNYAYAALLYKIYQKQDPESIPDWLAIELKSILRYLDFAMKDRYGMAAYLMAMLQIVGVGHAIQKNTKAGVDALEAALLYHNINIVDSDNIPFEQKIYCYVAKSDFIDYVSSKNDANLFQSVKQNFKSAPLIAEANFLLGVLYVEAQENIQKTFDCFNQAESQGYTDEKLEYYLKIMRPLVEPSPVLKFFTIQELKGFADIHKEDKKYANLFFTLGEIYANSKIIGSNLEHSITSFYTAMRLGILEAQDKILEVLKDTDYEICKKTLQGFRNVSDEMKEDILNWKFHIQYGKPRSKYEKSNPEQEQDDNPFAQYIQENAKLNSSMDDAMVSDGIPMETDSPPGAYGWGVS